VGNNEVGLAHIVFPKNLRYRPDAFMLIETPGESTRINVEFLVNESLDTLFQTLHDRFLQFGYDIQLKYN
jgi:hypothetical protein